MTFLKFILITMFLPLVLSAKVKVVTSTSDLAYYAERIGGEFVDASFIAPPSSDIHYIEARPSYMVKLSKADVALKVGMELDMWMDQLIDGSRNDHLLVVDCSKYIQPLEVPNFKADARYGDLHRFGNPHYWTGPQNAGTITKTIVEALSKVDGEHATQFAENQKKLLAEISALIEKLKPKLQKLQGLKVIYYHNSWPYFNVFTGVSSVQFVEPYPGVAPSPTHIKELIDLVKAGDAKIIAMEPYFDSRVPDKIAAETGAKVVKLYPSIWGRDDKETYREWLEYNIDALIEVKQ